ncbi:hypothetical protein [Clostridium tagluense]|uniref:hypothetical protein n=1 Tax=Clostridium tagluense TaxID=360422 RepID=UPI001CF58DD0|nr:hypothetical protein [Clostridium tagluense]MCB2299582.1 hypothetical protein [Clostridium tagluense]
METINIILNIVLFLIISQLATISHEFGHAIPTLIFTRDKVNIILGTNSAKTKIIKFSKLNIELRGFSPFVGFVNWSTDKMTKTQTIIVYAGGPIVSLIVTISLFIFSGTISNYVLKPIIDFSAYYHLYQFIITSIPIIYPKWWVGYGGYSSDGYNILRLVKNI